MRHESLFCRHRRSNIDLKYLLFGAGNTLGSVRSNKEVIAADRKVIQRCQLRMDGHKHIFPERRCLLGGNGRRLHHIVSLTVTGVSCIVSNSYTKGIHKLIVNSGQLRPGDTGFRSRGNKLLRLPGNIKAANAAAVCSDGVLTVSIPRENMQAAAARKIEVK